MSADEDRSERPNGEALLQLYIDASEHMRHYGNMRFAHLSLYFAVLGALLGVVAIGEPSELLCGVFALCAAGASALFWIMDERSSAFFYFYRDKAVDLELAQGLNLHQDRPDEPWLGLVRAANATRAMFCGGMVLSGFVFLDCIR